MPATVDITRTTGATGSPTIGIITNINTRANAFDSNTTADTTNPIQIPASGNNYSYWVSTRLTCSVSPAGTINNLRWYTSGTNPFGTGVTVQFGEASSYVQATGTPGQTGTALSTSAYSTLLAAPVNPFTYTSSSPYSLTGSLSNPSTGAFGNWIIYQIVVASTTLPGPTAQASFTWKYDET